MISEVLVSGVQLMHTYAIITYKQITTSLLYIYIYIYSYINMLYSYIYSYIYIYIYYVCMYT